MELGQEAQAVEPQAAEPQAAPPVAAEPQQQAAQDDGFIRVEKQQFADFGGGYHEAVKFGKSFQQLQQDGSLDSLEQTNRMLDAYRTQSGNQNASAKDMADALMAVEAPAPLPDDPSQQPLTQAAFEKMLEDREAKQKEQYEQETVRQGKVRETQTMDQKLEELGYPKDNPAHPHIKAVLNNAIANEIEKSFLPIQTPEQQMALMNAPASPEVIAAAAEATKAWLADFANTSAGAIASQQTNMPGSTLGSQTPGRQGAVKLSDLQSKAAAGDPAATEMLRDWGDGKIGADQVIRD